MIVDNHDAPAQPRGRGRRALPRCVYVIGMGSGAGKATVALGLAELLSRQTAPVGVFRPLVNDGADPTLTLLRERYQVELPYHDLYGATYAEAAALVADGRREDLISRIVGRYRAAERRSAAMVVVGSDFATDGSGGGTIPRELAFNARLATEFGGVVVIVLNGLDQDAASLESAGRSALHSLVDLGATVLAVIANRVPPGTKPPWRSPRAASNEPADSTPPTADAGLPDIDTTPGAASPTLSTGADPPVLAYAIPEVRSVSAPTVAEVATALGATWLAGETNTRDRDVLDFVVGAAQVPVLLDHLTDGCLMITPGDRNDLLVAVGAAHAAGQVSVSGVVLTRGWRCSPFPPTASRRSPGPTGSRVSSASTTRARSRPRSGRLSRMWTLLSWPVGSISSAPTG
jgi:phosphate acetyltransferase